MYAKDHLLIFSSFLDILENVEWPRFFGPPGRGRNLKLFKPQCSLNARKYSFAYRVIDILNSLSSDTVNANSISVFKHKL